MIICHLMMITTQNKTTKTPINKIVQKTDFGQLLVRKWLYSTTCSRWSNRIIRFSIELTFA
jgi:hypothetical protein